MTSSGQGGERRKWARLALAIPIFVRASDERGREILEFATALNVSAGGMLVAVRRTLPAAASIELEIPSAPIAALASVASVSKKLRAKTLRTTHEAGYCLLGVKFSRPLRETSRLGAPIQRKVLATV